MSAEKYVLHVMNRVRNSELEESLLTLPFSKVDHLFSIILNWLKNQWNSDLALKTIFFLLATHHKQIVTTSLMKKTLILIKDQVKVTTSETNDIIGFNMAALLHLKREIQGRKVVGFGGDLPSALEEEETREKKEGKNSKRKRIIIK